MSDKTAIEWTDATWNPITGCEKVSPGCDHCYAETFAERFRGTPGHYFEQGFDIVLRPDKLDQPLRWTRPRRIFVNSMSDLFHKDVPDEFIADVFAVMALAPQHTFQLLTKRHGRMRSLLRSVHFTDLVGRAIVARNGAWPVSLLDRPDGWMPLRNVHLGVSVEDQDRANLRIPALLDTPAAVRWLSMEPLLGPVSFRWAPWVELGTEPGDVTDHLDGLRGLDWIVVGGESGRGARPMHPAWARTLRDQCAAVGVPFLFKQWGEWVPEYANVHHDNAPAAFLDERGDFRPLINGIPQQAPYSRGDAITIRRAGKARAGRLLDGRTHDDFPEATR